MLDNENVTNEKQTKILLIILGIIILVSTMVIGYSNYKNAYDNNVAVPNEDEKNNIQEDNTMAIQLIDPSTENVDAENSQCSIETSKYLQRQSDSTYLANLTLENVDAAISEYWKCDFAPYYGGKINYKVSATYGKNNINFNLTTVNGSYGVSANINNNIITSPKFYTFNNEYLVVTQSSTNTTGPAINDGIYIYDENGNNVFKLENITLDIYDENSNLKNEVKYRKICEGAHFYEDCETITYGEIRYNPETKTFINITEEKSVN